MSEVAIRVDDVSKLYKLYDKPSDRLKESLGLTRKKLYKEHYALHNVSFDVKKRRNCWHNRNQRFRKIYDS